MITGPTYIQNHGFSIPEKDRKRSENEHREALDLLTQELRQARERERS